jgi:glycerol dehydrogenase-like iron-containing ADH family enzyme
MPTEVRDPGRLVPLEEASAVDVLRGLGPYTLAAADPPWGALAPQVPPPVRLLLAWDMELTALEALLDGEPDTEVVVGLGGGSALDTAKFLAWRTGKRLVQIPGITSVDAAFTEEIGVRVDRRVRYVGRAVPERVVLDLPLVRSAPPRLNRAGVGDILSCHTALHDWRLAADRGMGTAWDETWAQVGRTYLAELRAAADDIRAVSDDGVRYLADTYRRMGAAIAAAGHPRFEEGSEHFLAYAYERLTGAHQVHGELVSMCVVALAALQGNDPGGAADLVRRTGVRAHPLDLGIDRATFVAAVLALPGYVVDEDLDFSVANVADVTEQTARGLWEAVASLPRAS